MDGREDFLKQFLRHQSDLRAFIGSLVRDPYARDDLFQEVALILWRQFEAYDPARSFGAWARGIAANKILQHRPADGRAPTALAPEAVSAVRDAYDRTESAAADANPRAEALRDCVEQLPDKSRGLLQLRYERSLRLGDIAAQVSSTLEAVHKALSRIRLRLSECVGRKLAAERRN
jgi:RNA polymerase sigma-70 factor (ECF subfamily)